MKRLFIYRLCSHVKRSDIATNIKIVGDIVARRFDNGMINTKERYYKTKKQIHGWVNNISKSFKDIFRNTHTRQQFLLLSLFTTATLIVTVCVISSAYFKTILDSNTKYINNVVIQYKNEFTYNLREIDQMINGLAFNPAVESYLTAEAETYKRHLYASALVNYLSYFKSVKPAIRDISIFRCDMARVSYYDSLNPKVLDLDIFDHKPHSHCYGIIEYGGEYGGNNYKHLFSGCSVYTKNYASGNMEKIGIIVVSIDPYGLSIKLEELDGVDSVKYVVYDENNNIVNGNIDFENAEIIKIINEANSDYSIDYIETDCYKVNVVELEGLRGRILTVIDKSLLLKPVRRAIVFAGCILVIAIVLLMLMYYYSARNVVIPINEIIIFLQSTKVNTESKLEKRMPIVGNKDTKLLAREFNNMLDEISNLTYSLIEKNSRLYEMEISKKQSEIALLRSQINPHFLYNTLEVMRSIAVINDIPEIELISKDLAKLMRYSIKGQENVTLAKELEIIKSYIQIQNIRFKNKFITKYMIAPETLNCIIPKMTLQPIVENAISHGLELSPGVGNLVIHSYMERENMLVVRIIDDGVGINKDDLATINAKLALEECGFDFDKYTGIGLLNVNSRIKLTQGEEYGVRIKSRNNAGTEVIISFLVGGVQ